MRTGAVGDLRAATDLGVVGQSLYELCTELYPICRSITGDGVRRTLELVRRRMPLTVHEVSSGTQVFDWTVPKEWNIRDAWVVDPSGRRVIDFAASNLHVVSYSVPVRATLTLDELRPHLHTMPDRPDWVPYRTSYYKEDWGFCLRHRDLEALPEGRYEVVVDSTLEHGSLTYGELLLPGEQAEEVLLTAHVCHPSLCNDNLSGISLLAGLAGALASVRHRYTYRLLLIPGTIGSITWLARNEDVVPRIRHGIVVSGAGDAGPFTWKRSRRGDTEIDRVMAHVLAESGQAHRVIDFYPYGYDERQFCSPGFNLAVGRFGRTPHDEYPEYHTSADDLEFVGPATLGESFGVLLRAIEVLERNARYLSRNPKCEPQLGRRGLYRAVGGDVDRAGMEMALLWVMNLADGEHDVLDVARLADLPFDVVARAADALTGADLLRQLS